tara:strand:+ start:2362 stop:2592 length:231 start_codon:yes stop_codon:yes gene_type:complete
MSLKEKADAMRVVTTSKYNRHGYGYPEVVSTLYAYISELENRLAAPTPKVKAPAKKAPAKKAPAKKAPAKKKTTRK